MDYPRLPNQTRPSQRKAGVNRAIQPDVILMIANRMSKEMGRPLDHIELRALVTHIKKMDGNRLRKMPIKEMVEFIAMGYLKFMSQKDFHIYDTHEILKQYIGGGVKVNPDRFILDKECGTTGYTPSDMTSVVKGPHTNAYAMWAHLDRHSKEGYAPRTRAAGEPYVNYDSSQESKARLPPQIQDALAQDPGLPGPAATSKNIAIQDVTTEYDINDRATPVRPLVGNWVRRNNLTVPRQKSLTALFDSKYRDRSTDPSTFTWGVTYNSTQETGFASLPATIENITFMQFDSFYIPYVPDADNTYKKISIHIQELDSNSTVAHESRHYHLLFDTILSGDRILCRPPTQDEGKFRFNLPINALKQVTITFGSPLQQIRFLPDTYRVLITTNGPASTYLTFDEEHNMSDTQIIIIEDFNTLNPTGDVSIIAEMNSPRGHPVVVIDNFTLEIAVDTTAASMSTVQKTTVFVAVRRLFIPIRFAYVSE